MVQTSTTEMTVRDSERSVSEREVCVRAPGAACTAFTSAAGAAGRIGDLVFRVRLPLNMDRRTGSGPSHEQGTQRCVDRASNPLVKSWPKDVSGGVE
jgi:hypothetical protein